MLKLILTFEELESAILIRLTPEIKTSKCATNCELEHAERFLSCFARFIEEGAESGISIISQGSQEINDRIAELAKDSKQLARMRKANP